MLMMGVEALKKSPALALTSMIPGPEGNRYPNDAKLLADFRERFDPQNTMVPAVILDPPEFASNVDARTTAEDTIGKPMVLPLSWLKPDKLTSLNDRIDLLRKHEPHFPRVCFPIITCLGPKDTNLAKIPQGEFTEYPDSFNIPPDTKKKSLITFHTVEDIEDTQFKISWTAITNFYGDHLSDSSKYQALGWTLHQNKESSAGGGSTIFSPAGTVFIPTDFEILLINKPNVAPSTSQG